MVQRREGVRQVFLGDARPPAQLRDGALQGAQSEDELDASLLGLDTSLALRHECQPAGETEGTCGSIRFGDRWLVKITGEWGCVGMRLTDCSFL